MGLTYIALGVGDAFSASHYSACLAVESEGRWLLVDCPHPIRKVLREGSKGNGAALDVGSFDAVIVTHVHGDHCSGLEGMGLYAYFTLERKVTLAMHPESSRRLWDGRLAGGMESIADMGTWGPVPRAFADYFDMIDLDHSRPVQIGPFSIECRRTLHHVPTYALRIRADGRSLGVSADTAWDPTLVEWLSPCDAIVHETGHGIHTPYEKLAALPADLRRKMRLTHYPDDVDLSGGAIEPLVQGKRYGL
jgi:ribonuclease BN (tRNA processing enzyme)